MVKRQSTDFEALARSTRMHFIVGLPRSGSTLLAALLNQNPRVHATGPSAAYHLFSNLYSAMSDDGEAPSLMNDDQRASVLKSVVHSVHAPMREAASVVFDTNRKWPYRIDQLVELFPLCQFIVSVRNPADILSSLEKINLSTPIFRSRLFHSHEVIDQRMQRLMAHDGMVGSAMMLTKELLLGPHAERCLVVDYDRLTRAPVTTMQALYSFIREPHFEHDLESFSFEAPAFDAFLNTLGLHTVKGPLRPSFPEMQIPPEMVEAYSKQAFWKDISSTAKLLIG
jgi:sulfotransferase